MTSSEEELPPVIKRRRKVVGFIEDERKRRVTLSKRKDGLFRKLKMLCREHPGTEVAAVVVSEGGVAYSFEYPPKADVFRRFVTSTATTAETRREGPSIAADWSLGELERLEEVVRKLKERLVGG